MASREPVIHVQKRARGFTLVEVLVALVVLTVGVAGLIQLLSQAQQQHQRRRASEEARRIAQNEVQRARSAGAWSIPQEGSTSRVNAYGAPDADGPFQVVVGHDVECDPHAGRPDDSGAEILTCPGAHARITIRVEHLRDGDWITRAQRTLHQSYNGPAVGSWNPAGHE
jgi:prepilin-type N-terminal cleavage/methylation domain-containing protein